MSTREPVAQVVAASRHTYELFSDLSLELACHSLEQALGLPPFRTGISGRILEARSVSAELEIQIELGAEAPGGNGDYRITVRIPEAPGNALDQSQRLASLLGVLFGAEVRTLG